MHICSLLPKLRTRTKSYHCGDQVDFIFSIYQPKFLMTPVNN